MSSSMCRSRRGLGRYLAATAVLLAAALGSARARAQACCAGAGVITPGRLALHEDALVGAQLKMGVVTGSFDNAARYRGLADGTAEIQAEEGFFGAIRLLERGQASLFVPLVHTYRASAGVKEVGGGVGDTNVGLRYDFTRAGSSRYVPGIAVLAGLTVPTGRPPETVQSPLASGATGIGAFQGTLGLALEQAYGPWLFGLSSYAARRATRDVQGLDVTLGTQLTTLASAAYTFDNDAALAVVVSYMLEDSATVNGAEAAGSARNLMLLSLSGVLPLSDRVRLLGSLFDNPPISHLGRNQPATLGFTFAILHSWS